MGHKEPLNPTAFDIETEGLRMGKEITVAGLRFPAGVLVLLNSDGQTVPEQLEGRVESKSGVDTVQLQQCDSERALLERLHEEATERIQDKNRMIVAYNGETWRGGFDLPFLRTRCGKNEVPWPFPDIPYADLMPIVKKRINTTVDGEDEPTEISDLCGAFDVLIGGEHCDPYDDSNEAVSAAYNGDWESLLLHNIADIDRTQQLADWMQRYVPASDFQLKNLGPPRGGRW
jgi:hypothetical protein